MFFWDIRILWITFTSLGEELWRWIDWNLVPSPAILTGLPMGRAGQMASKQKEQWCHDRLGSHVAVFCCGTRSLDTAKTQMLGSRYGADWCRSVQVWSSWVYPTMTGLKSPFACPESQAPDSLPRLGRPAPWCMNPLLVAKSRFYRGVIPSNIPTSKKTRKNHEKPKGYPMNIPSFSMASNHGFFTEATSRSSAVPTVCWSTIAGTCARLGRRAEESSSITPRRWRAFDSYVAW